MADFRKWLVAFAVVVILLGFAPTALAVSEQTPLTCAVTAAPRAVRGEGVTELMGDLILTCSGGSPTPAGQPVQLSSVIVSLAVPVTSRTLGTVKAGNTTSKVLTSEAMLEVDEPFPADPFPDTGVIPIPGSPLEQLGCIASGGQVPAGTNPYTHSLSGNVGVCEIMGSSDGSGGLTYLEQYNTFQGISIANTTTGYYEVEFNGVPLDPPGSQNTRIIRINNVRGDVTGLLGPSNSANGVQVAETVTITGSSNFTVPVTSVYVASVYQGLLSGGVKGTEGAQCQKFDGSFSITFAEGFVSSFKTAEIDDTDAESSGTNGLQSQRNDEDATPMPQNITFLNYFTESGYTPTPSNTFPLTGANQDGVTPDDIGVADYGTRFLITVDNLQNGVSVDFPASVNGGSGSPNLELYIVPNANSDGTGGSPSNANDVTLAGTWVGGGPSTSLFVVYEVVADDPTQLESITINPGVTWTPNLPAGIPAINLPASPSYALATVSFAPIAKDRPGIPLPWNNDKTNTATTRGSLPRFINTGQTPSDAITIYPCSCNLLFPWVVGGADTGFDTGFIVGNDSVSPTIWPITNGGTTPTDQTGTVTLWFTGQQGGASIYNVPYPKGTMADPPIVLPPGCELTLIMSSGTNINCPTSLTPSNEGSISTAVTTGFIGYVIATTTFQYCHGLADVTPLGDPFHTSFYEALQLDQPRLYRTGQRGENVGH